MVGSAVGFIVGFMVGSAVGFIVGFMVGSAVGFMVGLSVIPVANAIAFLAEFAAISTVMVVVSTCPLMVTRAVLINSVTVSDDSFPASERTVLPAAL